MKLLVDMNLSPRWIPFLRQAGWETSHWSDVGEATASDSEIMGYAAANDYVVFTHDLDLSAILAATHAKKPSVIQVRNDDVSPEQIGDQIVIALRHMQMELEVGALLTVEPQRTRLRLLPLQINR